MEQVYSTAIHIFVRRWQIVLGLSLAIACTRFLPGWSRPVAWLFWYGIAIYVFHHAILARAKPNSDWDMRLQSPYFWVVYLGHIASCAVVYFAAVFIFVGLDNGYAEAALVRDVFGARLYLWTLTWLAVSSLFLGTLYSDAMINHKLDVSRAVHRSMILFWPTLGRLVCGPLLVFVLIHMLALLIGVAGQLAWPVDARPVWISFASACIFAFAFLFFVATGVSVLVNQYLTPQKNRS